MREGGTSCEPRQHREPEAEEAVGEQPRSGRERDADGDEREGLAPTPTVRSGRRVATWPVVEPKTTAATGTLAPNARSPANRQAMSPAQ